MSFLSHFGNVMKKVLGIATQVAQIASPLIAIEFPVIAPLYNSAIGLALAAEATAANASGTGPQKLAVVMAQLQPQVLAWAAANHINWPQADIQKWVSAVVDTLNLVPVPVSVVPAAPAARPAAPVPAS